MIRLVYPFHVTRNFLEKIRKELENIYIFRLPSQKILRQIWQQSPPIQIKRLPPIPFSFPLLLALSCYFLSPQKFILLHKQFWFERRVDINKKLLLLSWHFVPKLIRRLLHRAGWRKNELWTGISTMFVLFNTNTIPSVVSRLFAVKIFPSY